MPRNQFTLPKGIRNAQPLIILFHDLVDHDDANHFSQHYWKVVIASEYKG